MKRLPLLFSLTLLLMACSRTQLAYDNADWLLERYAAKSVAISAEQQAQWQPVLAEVLERHRRDELPHIVAYLDLASELIDQTDPSTGATCLLDGAMTLARRHARHAVDLAVPLLAELDATQINHLREYMNKRQQKLAERYLDPDLESREAKREERFSERVESWIGPMSAEQRILVMDALRQIPDLTPVWLAHREQQSESLLALLESHATPDVLEEYLSSWWVNWDNRPPDYLRQWRIARLEFTAFLAELAPTLSEKQREKLRKRLGKLRGELAGLLPADHSPVEVIAADPGCAYPPA